MVDGTGCVVDNGRGLGSPTGRGSSSKGRDKGPPSESPENGNGSGGWALPLAG